MKTTTITVQKGQDKEVKNSLAKNPQVDFQLMKTLLQSCLKVDFQFMKTLSQS
jgi:hypothetical protein